MKIVVIGPQFTDSFARNVSVTLAGMGHEVISIAGTRVLHHQSKWARRFWRFAPQAFPSMEVRDHARMVQEVERARPDLVLVTIGNLPPEVVGELRARCGVPVVCWFTDPTANWHRQYLLAAPWDAMFLKEPAAVRLLSCNLGQRAFYLPEAMNPLWHQPVQPTEQDQQKYGCDLLAQGTLHYYRARMLEPLAGYDLKIWGANNPAWLHSPVKKRYMNRFLGEGEKARAFACAKIAVNIVSHQEIEGVNCSLFEYASCGLFQIAEFKPALQELFTPETEIVTYTCRQELLEKVDYYLCHAEARQEIAARAQARAAKEHTYEVRLKSMLATLGI